MERRISGAASGIEGFMRNPPRAPVDPGIRRGLCHHASPLFVKGGKSNARTAQGNAVASCCR